MAAGPTNRPRSHGFAELRLGRRAIDLRTSAARQVFRCGEDWLRRSVKSSSRCRGTSEALFSIPPARKSSAGRRRRPERSGSGDEAFMRRRVV